MFKKLCALLDHRQGAEKQAPEGTLAASQLSQGAIEWHWQQLQHNREWMRDFWSDKSLCPGTQGQEATSLPAPEELDPHWYILKYLCRWSRTHYETAPQELIDRAVAESLGISRTHAVLMRQGILNARPIWPDTLIMRDGSYPWATLEISIFWSLLDGMSVDQLAWIGKAAAERKEELKRHWREIHRIVAQHYSDYAMVLYNSAAAPLHPCAPEHIGELHQAKARASFEVMATRLVADPVPCPNLALFGFKTPDALPRQGSKEEAGQ